MVKGTAQITDEKLLKQIACGIKQMRVSRGITQEVFYNDTNIHIGRIERGTTNISVSTIKELPFFSGLFI
ncbi:MAG: helix-turn-helix transcriptional regulator, partial [Bacteroidales bacterium]|nr:helix-turn-helix transcriptional regulator [Bacteroidales bacterium]